MKIATIDDDISEFLNKVNLNSVKRDKLDVFDILKVHGIYLDKRLHMFVVSSGSVTLGYERFYEVSTYYFPEEDFLPYIRELKIRGMTEINTSGFYVLRMGFNDGTISGHSVSVQKGFAKNKIEQNNFLLNPQIWFFGDGLRINSDEPIKNSNIEEMIKRYFN